VHFNINRLVKRFPLHHCTKTLNSMFHSRLYLTFYSCTKDLTLSWSLWEAFYNLSLSVTLLQFSVLVRAVQNPCRCLYVSPFAHVHMDILGSCLSLHVCPVNTGVGQMVHNYSETCNLICELITLMSHYNQIVLLWWEAWSCLRQYQRYSYPKPAIH